MSSYIELKHPFKGTFREETCKTWLNIFDVAYGKVNAATLKSTETMLPQWQRIDNASKLCTFIKANPHYGLIVQTLAGNAVMLHNLRCMDNNEIIGIPGNSLATTPWRVSLNLHMFQTVTFEFLDLEAKLGVVAVPSGYFK